MQPAHFFYNNFVLSAIIYFIPLKKVFIDSSNMELSHIHTIELCSIVVARKSDKLEIVTHKGKEDACETGISFSGASPTKSRVRSTADANRLDFGG